MGEQSILSEDDNNFYARVRNEEKWNRFAQEIDRIGESIKTSVGSEDFAHFKKLGRWGRISTLLGYMTAWIIPNPISAFLISQGNYARWSLTLHPVSHGAMDQVPNIPDNYTSKKFARGARRLFDWLDWITPENWNIEHNQMHHYHLGTSQDPDIVWRNTKFIREMKVPVQIRYSISLLVVCFWKPFYYAPNTMIESRFHKGTSDSNKITSGTWSLATSEGRELWLTCMLPYFLFRFVFLPLLFLPIGKTAVAAVLINSVLAELMTNIHSFATIGPNHTGDDIYTYSDAAKGRGDFYLRQIIGTMNYPAGSDLTDFLYGGMNYQIEHHLWPKASLYQCKKVRPELQALCKKYDVPYNESHFFPRFVKTVKTMAGACEVLEAHTSIDGF